RWLAAPHILESTRAEFEALLLEIAEPAEEWITSAQSLGLAKRFEVERVLPWDRHTPVGVAAGAGSGSAAPRRRHPMDPRRGGASSYRGSGLPLNGRRP